MVLAAVGMPQCSCRVLSLPQDYPSLSMIVAKLQEFNIYPIFAVSNASDPTRAAEIYQMYQVRGEGGGEGGGGGEVIEGRGGGEGEGVRGEGRRSESLRSEGVRSDEVRSEGVRSEGVRSEGVRSEGVRSEGVRCEGRDEDMMYAGIACKCVREHTTMGTHTHGLIRLQT